MNRIAVVNKRHDEALHRNSPLHGSAVSEALGDIDMFP